MSVELYGSTQARSPGLVIALRNNRNNKIRFNQHFRRRGFICTSGCPSEHMEEHSFFYLLRITGTTEEEVLYALPDALRKIWKNINFYLYLLRTARTTGGPDD